MAQDMMMFEGGGNLPAHLQGVDTGVTKALLAGMFTGGNRIGLKGSRFHLIVNGIEEGVINEPYLDTTLLSAAPAISRVYYAGAYKQGEKVPPTCYSPDNIAPPLDVPQRQSDKCATCPQNVKGSKVDGGQKYKACGYFRRTVVMLAGDIEDRRAFKLDVKSQSLFGDSTATEKSFNDYIKMLESRGVDAGQVVTRISFDTDSSVPKLLFKPARYISAEELEAVQYLVASEEVARMAEVNMGTVDFSTEEPEPTAEAQQEAAQAPAQQTATAPQTTPQKPAAAPQAAQKPAPVAQRPAPQTAQRPQTTKQQTSAPVVETVPATVVQKPQTQAPVQQAPVQAAPVQEVGSADDLESLLDELEV